MNRRPNIVIITTHDTGRHLGCYGVNTVASPNIDALAQNGIKLTNCFAAVPICCASRATMLTGRYPQSHGLMDLCFPPFNWKLHDDELHLSQILRRAGYRTHLFGFQHEVNNNEIARLEFDETACAPGVPPADEVARVFADFLEQRAAGCQPFYAQVGFRETHSPFTWGGAQPDDRRGVHVPPYLVPSEPIVQMLREFQGMITKADAAVGTIADALRKSGLEENTILVFCTDHGIEFPRAKWTLYDPGIEIAMIMRWPGGGVAGGRNCDWLLSNLDFVPTVLDFGSVPIPAKVQGKSFARGLLDPEALPVNEVIFGLFSKRCEGRFVRSREFKLIQNFGITHWYNKPVDMTNPADYWVTPNVELYDLVNDPNEFNNLADNPKHAREKAMLQDRLFRWMEAVADPILKGPLRTPFYEKSLAEYLRWQQASRPGR